MTDLEHADRADLEAVGEPAVLAIGRGAFGVRDSGDTSGFGGLVRTLTAPPAATPPYGGWFDEACALIRERLDRLGAPGGVERVIVEHGALRLLVARQCLLEVAQLLRDHPRLRFEMCMSVSGVHWPADHGAELHALYHLLSVTHNRRIALEVTCPDADPHIPSIVPVYPGADWHERETYDFFGIIFDDHPHLTRIEMPDDWPGHPQRKDYPLGGIPVEYKGALIPAPDERRAYQ